MKRGDRKAISDSENILIFSNNPIGFNAAENTLLSMRAHEEAPL